MGDDRSVDQAKDLVSEVVKLARDNDYKGLLAVEADPETEPLLSLLPDRQVAQARSHLESSRAWKVRRNEKARKKMDNAATALAELDVVLAKGILRKIDTDLLGGADQERYDELLLAITARDMELDQIRSQIPEGTTEDDKGRGRRFWRR